MCFMDMHILMTQIIDNVCRTALRKIWYLTTATMNFLRNPSTHFSFFTSNSYDRPPKKITFGTLVPSLRSRRHHPSSQEIYDLAPVLRYRVIHTQHYVDLSYLISLSEARSHKIIPQSIILILHNSGT